METNINLSSIDISNQDKLECPDCAEYCTMKNSLIKFNKNNPVEFESIICKKCSFEFCYILCVFCQKKIYMKIHIKSPKYNGMNGYNIICPFKFCEKIFYFTECIKCKRAQKIKKFIKEGENIECQYEDCKYIYIQNNCPMLNCLDIFPSEKNQNYNNFPQGILSKHENKIIYQKIYCCYCFRPIVYPSSREHMNGYYECQIVECPYEKCKKTFNRITCPFCFYDIYVKDGWYVMGSKIKCINCKKYFGKILCPSCKKINSCQEEYFQFGKMLCGFQNCRKQNYMINCIFCRKLNVFKKDIPINGQLIKCGYCHNIFNECLCPFCKYLIPFPSGDFSFGKIYKCIYINCLKKFQFLICPNCFSYSFKSDTQEGKKLKCQNCGIKFMNWGCPFCKSNIMDKNTSLKFGQMVKCPNINCGKKYSFIRCSKCEKLIFSNENENILGMSVRCPHRGCGKYTLVSHCPICDTKAIYSDIRNNYSEGDLIHCPNPACDRQYPFKRYKDIYQENLRLLEPIEGATIKFGIAQVDENYNYKESLFIDKRALNNYRLFPTQCLSLSKLDEKVQLVYGKNKSNGVCMICNNNRKESIFYPCGHRCVCYNCAVMYFSVFKKCPKCRENAKCIIRKVYE